MADDELTGYLRYLQSEKRYSVHTRISYENDLRQFKEYLLVQFELHSVAESAHFHIRSWLAGLKEDKLAARSINRKISSLNNYFKYMRKLGLVTENPVRKLHAQRLPERLPVYLKESESEFLLNEVTFPEGFEGMTQRLICELLYVTGVRRNELLELRENSIEWSLKQIRVLGKGNKERLVPVGAAITDILREYLHAKRQLPVFNSDYLLNLESGKPLYAGFIYRTVTKYLSLATTNNKKSPHVLRHTFATHLLGNGANIQAISSLLGHSSLAATQVYTHTDISKLKEIHLKNHPRG